VASQNAALPGVSRFYATKDFYLFHYFFNFIFMHLKWQFDELFVDQNRQELIILFKRCQKLAFALGPNFFRLGEN
jgi:hypothetical protein